MLISGSAIAEAVQRGRFSDSEVNRLVLLVRIYSTSYIISGVRTSKALWKRLWEQP
jgi:hypothetical protein